MGRAKTMEIKDKTINICICGKSRKKLLLDSKSRVLGWMATAALLLMTSATIFDVEIFLQDISDTINNIDIKSIVAYLVVAYLMLATLARCVIYKFKHKHSLRCSLRMAWLKFAYW